MSAREQNVVLPFSFGKPKYQGYIRDCLPPLYACNSKKLFIRNIPSAYSDLDDLCLQGFVVLCARGRTGQPLEQAEHGQGCWAGLPGLQEDNEEGKRFISQLGWWPLINWIGEKY